MDKLNIIYDHYKETVSMQKVEEKIRNKIFAILCFFILLLLLMTGYPDSIYANIKELFSNYLKINITFELGILEMFNWFIILYLTIRYYQINVNIDKNYKYIHDIENKLENSYKLPIYREGRNYLKKYPGFLTLSYWFYKYFFPVLFSLCLIVKFILSITNKCRFIVLIISIVVSIILVYINISYFIFNLGIWKEENKNDKT